MRHFQLWLLFMVIAGAAAAQTRLGIHVGYTGTYTRIAEYERIERRDFLLDSVYLKKSSGFLQAMVTLEVDMGKGFYYQPGWHYSRKGLTEVRFRDSTGYDWVTTAYQHYVGLSQMLGYRIRLHDQRMELALATGLQADFAVGTPNGGALFSGPYYRFFMPFCRFNEVELGWCSEGSFSCKAGPGMAAFRLRYIYGLSDVLEDAFVIGRSMTLGLSLGYIVKF
jgi:hypothetical protein